MRGTGDEVRLQVPKGLMTMIKKGVWVAVKLRLVFDLSMPTSSDPRSRLFHCRFAQNLRDISKMSTQCRCRMTAFPLSDVMRIKINKLRSMVDVFSDLFPSQQLHLLSLSPGEGSVGVLWRLCCKGKHCSPNM